MTLVARELPLAPNPLALARRLSHERELILLWSASGEGPSYIAIRPLAESSSLDPEPTLELAPRAGLLGSVPRWIGVVPYEALRGIERPTYVAAHDPRPEPQVSQIRWWRFGAVVSVTDRVLVVGDDAGAVAELSRELLTRPERSAGSANVVLRESEPAERHAERVRAALDLIRAGQVYQVNLARRLDLAVSGDVVDVLGALCRDTRPPFAAALRCGELSIVSTSPELLLEQRAGGRISTEPIKGTRPRGTDAASDAHARRELDADPKERAELAMIVDVERNDIGRVSRIGTVVADAPRVTTHGLVWHRRATVSGELSPGVSRRELLSAVLPSGSVTGAPKVRAMELIATLESQRRGLYTGGLGFLTHGGEIRLAMAIRTLTARGDVGHYFTGGGIVADSDPGREVRETLWKAQQLFGAVGRTR